MFWRHTKWIFLLSRLLGFTHSSLFQCIWNFQSHHFLFSLVIFLFISFSSFLLLLNLLLFSGGRLSPNVSTHQPPPMACNNDLRFPFGLGWLGSPTGIFWNNSFMKWVYIWKRPMKLCSKAFIQQRIKSIVAPSDSTTAALELLGVPYILLVVG